MRVVLPESVRLSLTGDDWILVKKRLNVGEHRRMMKRGTTATEDGDLRVDRIELGLAKVLAYVLDVSVQSPTGVTIAVYGNPAALEDAIDSLPPESYTEILRAVEAHENAMQAERDAEKNGRDGERQLPGISPSPSGATGPSTSSAASTATTTQFSSTS